MSFSVIVLYLLAAALTLLYRFIYSTVDSPFFMFHVPLVRGARAFAHAHAKNWLQDFFLLPCLAWRFQIVLIVVTQN